jgi:hypothetical protein
MFCASLLCTFASVKDPVLGCAPRDVHRDWVGVKRKLRLRNFQLSSPQVPPPVAGYVKFLDTCSPQMGSVVGSIHGRVAFHKTLSESPAFTGPDLDIPCIIEHWISILRDIPALPLACWSARSTETFLRP